MKKSYDSPKPLCWFHSPEYHEARLKHAELARIAQKNKRHAPVPILDALEQGANEVDRDHAKWQAAENARKAKWEARGWSLEHRIVNGYRIPCDKPTCYCQPKLPKPTVTAVLESPQDPARDRTNQIVQNKESQ